MKPRSLSLNDIRVGDVAEFTKDWSEKDVEDFAKLSGDYNPLHMDDEYAAATKFGKRLVHGMLTASLCSRLLGMYLPGEKCLYLEQTLSFKKPVFIGELLFIKGTVTAKSEVTSILTIAISVTKGDDEVMVGVARVQVL